MSDVPDVMPPWWVVVFVIVPVSLTLAVVKAILGTEDPADD